MYRLLKTSAIVAYALVLMLLRHLSASPILGVKSLLSGATLVAPAIGFFSSRMTCIILYLARTACAAASSVPIVGGTLYLPTLAGSLVLSARSRNLERGITLLCFSLFIVHPVGGTSYLYTLYWLIPLGITFLHSPPIFARALSSTFITHAVGSTIFIYTHQTDPIFWSNLIPQVWFERVTHTLALTACYYVGTFIIKSITQQHFEGHQCQEL